MRNLIVCMRNLIAWLRRHLIAVNWRNLRSVKPVSNVFGFDRGTPIDRTYIEDFIKNNKSYIKGNVLEIAESTYSKQFGEHVDQFIVLHVNDNNKQATIVGDLTKIDALPECAVHCFICTQTLNFIYDFKAAIVGIRHLLKEKGVALVTVAGISQISRYDMEKWGDYWRFTPLSIEKTFKEVFGEQNVEVKVYGNVLAAISLLEGLASEELTRAELMFSDPDYPVTIAIKATKNV